MKAAVLLALVLVSTALAQNSTKPIPGTTVVSALTTVCGTATVITQNGNYYTCTDAMTLTITDCPCTMTHPSYFANISVPTANPISISTIIVPAFCPTTTTTLLSPTLAQNADYTPTCQAPAAASGGGGGGGSGGANDSPLSTPQQGYAAGNTMRPIASQYAYTSAGTRNDAVAGNFGAAVLFFCAAVFVVAAVRLPGF